MSFLERHPFTTEDGEVIDTSEKLWDHLTKQRQEHWLELAAAYTENPDVFYLAYGYLNEHPIFHHYRAPGRFYSMSTYDLTPEDIKEIERPINLVSDAGVRNFYLYITKTINEDSNDPVTWADTSVLFHIESGPFFFVSGFTREDREVISVNGRSTHDYRMDVQEPSYEAAIIAYAKQVKAYYGDDRSRIHELEDLA